MAISPFVIQGGVIGAELCMHTGVNPRLIQIMLSVDIFRGTCIIIAASSGLILAPDAYTTQQPRLLAKLKAVIIAKDIPYLSKALLRHGQRYYLIELFHFLAFIPMMTFEAIPLPYRIGSALFGHVLLHCRSCSVFRNVGISKHLREEGIDIGNVPISFQSRTDSVGLHPSHGEGDVSSRGFESQFPSDDGDVNPVRKSTNVCESVILVDDSSLTFNYGRRVSLPWIYFPSARGTYNNLITLRTTPFVA
ncbi:hypothetical protein PM082_012478 [Marasmius tenuissimus]|nr:hypothetical protein PM082_012478 [Marasmius tenuissimus]